MNCPSCQRALSELKIGEILVDVCRGGCGGIWFDRFELQKMDAASEHAGEEILHIPVDPAVKIDHAARKKCPKCEGIILMRHFYSPNREAEVDECPSCAGFWLDLGELQVIRSQFKTDDDRKKAVEGYFNEMFGEQLVQMKKESDEQNEKARKIGRALRFICPSYYIPGKQEWGGF